MSPTDKLVKLCHGAEAVGSGIEIQFKPSNVPGEWAIVMIAGAVILISTEFTTLDGALDQACQKIASMSTRMMAAVKQSNPPAPPDTEKDG